MLSGAPPGAGHYGGVSPLLDAGDLGDTAMMISQKEKEQIE